MSDQMIIRIDPDLKSRLYKLARSEGKSSSQMVRELIQDYLKERDVSAYIDDLWKRIGAKLVSKGVTIQAVDKAIARARKSQK